MLHSGLVSITFRKLTPPAIIDLVAQAGLDAIEWGGDIHVPHGDVEQARAVRAQTEAAGLTVASYGSYYRAGHPDSAQNPQGHPVSFEALVETAAALGAPTLRIWAGRQGSDVADAGYWMQVVADSRRVAGLAAQAGIAIAYEFHGNTLTDTNTSAHKLLQTVNDDPDAGNSSVAHTYWQPPKGSRVDDNLAGLEMIEPWLANVHAFSWRDRDGATERLPLAANAAAWERYLNKIALLPGDRFVMIEFVRDDEPQQFLEDAATLKSWLAPSS